MSIRVNHLLLLAYSKSLNVLEYNWGHILKYNLSAKIKFSIQHLLILIIREKCIILAFLVFCTADKL